MVGKQVVEEGVGRVDVYVGRITQLPWRVSLQIFTMKVEKRKKDEKKEVKK